MLRKCSFVLLDKSGVAVAKNYLPKRGNVPLQ